MNCKHMEQGKETRLGLGCVGQRAGRGARRCDQSSAPRDQVQLQVGPRDAADKQDDGMVQRLVGVGQWRPVLG